MADDYQVQAQYATMAPVAPQVHNMLYGQLDGKQVFDEIAAKQDARAQEILARRAQELAKKTSTDPRTRAAELIQRNYRGHRIRQAVKGYSLDPSLRWIDALKDAQYANATSPVSREQHATLSPTQAGRAHDRWKRAHAIARQAGNDDTSEGELDEVEDEEERKKISEGFRKKKSERDKYAKQMGLDYFLEMIDQKHRYGSNLRRYHKEWKESETHESFFFWLDEGEGKGLDLEDRPRTRLDTEQVRYLSREERRRYLVKIDAQGRFTWAKDGELITTSPEFKDSIKGIVPVNDSTPTWREVTTGVAPEPSGTSSSSSDSMSGISTGSQEDSSKYANEELHDAKGLAKLNHLSVDTVLNHMLRKTTKKNTWIFVADTSFRIYIGIKQSGAFQHSSFLKGGRICAAGLIKIKRGQLRKLSPLSGHYAPPVRNFKGFVKSLKEARADMSRCNISRSYAILLGLEGYVGMKKKVRTAERSVKDVLNPGEKRRREEAEKDNSQSAERERQVLAQQEQHGRGQSFSTRLMQKMGLDDAKQHSPPSPPLKQPPTKPERVETAPAAINFKQDERVQGDGTGRRVRAEET